MCVTVDRPVLDDPPGLREIVGDVFVQAFVTQTAIDAFDKGILRRFTDAM